MSGVLVIGTSGVGKTTLVNDLRNPSFLDGDDVVHNTVGWPDTAEGDDPWFITMPEAEQVLFATLAYEPMITQATKNWVLTGLGPVPESVLRQMKTKNLQVYFITTTKKALERNLDARAAEGNFQQPVQLDTVWRDYEKSLKIAVQNGYTLVPYNEIKSRFLKWSKARKPAKLDVIRCGILNDCDTIEFTWKSKFIRMSHDENLGKFVSTTFVVGGAVDAPFDYYYTPGSEDYKRVVLKLEKQWFAFRRTL